MGLIRAALNWWKPRKRELFHYWDGKQIRQGDPYRIWRFLANHKEFNMESMVPLVDANQEPETSITIAAFREAFGVEGWDEKTRTGLTDHETASLFIELCDYLAELKKNTSPGQTLPEPTASPPSTGPEDQAETTKPSSDST